MPRPRRHVAASPADRPPRAWQRMLSGRRLDLLDPSPLDIEISDIAHGLARVARWNGQTVGDHAFSVAQHSLLVEALCAQATRPWGPAEGLFALLHDAAEYVIGDMISPFKAALGIDYRIFEDRLSQSIHLRFGLPPAPSAELKAAIKRADAMSAYLEATQLAGFTPAEAEKFFLPPPRGVHWELVPAPAAEAQSTFLKRFDELLAQLEDAR